MTVDIKYVYIKILTLVMLSFGFVIACFGFCFIPAFADSPKVYIDAGHGWGSDRGAVGNYNGVPIYEQDLTAELATLTSQYLASKSSAIGQYVNLSGNHFSVRAQDAVNRGCNLFVSLHFNSGGGTGTESYVYADLGQRNPNSDNLRNQIHDRLVRVTQLRDRGKKYENFAVCRAPMPSTLLEIAFIDNSNDIRLYQLNKHNIANAIAEGIYQFCLPNIGFYSPDGKWVLNGGRYSYQKNDGTYLKNDWVVTNDIPGRGITGDLQRYYIGDDGYLLNAGCYRLNQGGKLSWFYVRPEGFVVRGCYDNGYGRVYVADNDGRLAEAGSVMDSDGGGWLVTAAYSSELQRYYIDGRDHAARTAIFEVEGNLYFGQGGVGYVLRNTWLNWEGNRYWIDNDGILHLDKNGWSYESGKYVFYSGGNKAKGWIVTDKMPNGIYAGLQRYFIGDDGYLLNAGCYRLNQGGKLSWFYVRPEGFVVRGCYDNGYGRVYVADNDGRLAEAGSVMDSDGGGWLVTAAYSSELQRYYIDGRDHAARTAIFEVEGNLYFGQGGVGYVLRNTWLNWEGNRYWIDNDGILNRYNSIMGNTLTNVSQMVRRFSSAGVNYPSNVYTQYGAPSINDFCTIILQEANAEGVRAEVVFSQIVHETGWLQFGGDVKAEQCNFAGIGATGGGNPGNSFNTYGTDSVRIGIRAQVQHLKAYGSAAPLNQSCVDPRFNYVQRGCAPTVEALGGKWATGAGYGNALIRQMDALLQS